jgi:hypothetical protein
MATAAGMIHGHGFLVMLDSAGSVKTDGATGRDAGAGRLGAKSAPALTVNRVRLPVRERCRPVHAPPTPRCPEKGQAFVAQRCADTSAARTSAAEAGAAGWVQYWSSLVTT